MSSNNLELSIWVAELRNGFPAKPDDWILVSPQHGWSDKPRWSPDGNTVYFTSDEDGFRCVWGRHLSPATKQPAGAEFPVYHLHKTRLSPRNLDLGSFDIAVGQDKLVLNLGELTGNIWSVSAR